MSLYNYVGTPNTNLVCCICRAPFTDPTTTLTCSHTFCSACILRALSHSPLCPVDRSPLSLADLGPASPIVRSMVDELEVECPHRGEGCGYTGERQVMPVQEEEEEVEEVKEEIHTCPHASVGCPYEGSLTPAAHLASCPYESLKGFFAINNAKVSLLTEQNMILRHRVDSLESTVHTLRREMGATRHVLGPWFRAAYQGGVGYGGVTSSELPVGLQPASASSSGEGEMDAFAPYFPPEESVAMARRHRAASIDAGYGRTVGVVAPLDLGTSLEGTLSGLRESMVGLAAGVDSVGRRSEIGLTNETLRLGEEMMSVRAQMHGLRMQVHGMMMDRNAGLRGGMGMDGEGQYMGQIRNSMNFAAPSITKL
ncbi:hypothetical protein B0H34DRAFT_351180 [Crassisporium funariophilum]|nr:hypothetical protein B0H34DRAFT_351180 [Crassisporium funariophilum]